MWDLTYTIREDMLLYPGIPQPRLHDFATPAKDGYGMSEFQMWNHLGTHIDAPTHFYADGWSLDQFPPETFVKTVHTVVCPSHQDISESFLRDHWKSHRPGDGVLLLTGQYQYWGTQAYFNPFPTLTDDGAAYVLSQNVSMVLVDAPSVDLVDTTTFPNHHQLLQRPLVIVENLAYQSSLPETFRVIALPLKVHRSNGSPARVIAFAMSE